MPWRLQHSLTVRAGAVSNIIFKEEYKTFLGIFSDR